MRQLDNVGLGFEPGCLASDAMLFISGFITKDTRQYEHSVANGRGHICEEDQVWHREDRQADRFLFAESEKECSCLRVEEAWRKEEKGL